MGNFLMQEVDSLIRGVALRYLLLTNANKLIREMKIGGSLGCGAHALVEFMILRALGQVKSKIKTLNFRRVNSELFEELVGVTSW